MNWQKFGEGVLQKVTAMLLIDIIKSIDERLYQATKAAEERHSQVISEIAELKSMIQNLQNSAMSSREKEDDGSNNQLATRFIDFPVFDGTELSGWLFKCELIFQLVHTPESTKVSLASLHFTGKALEWHQSYVKNKGEGDLPRWEDYVVDLKARFGDWLEVNSVAELKRLNQEGDLLEYIEAFDACACRTTFTEENLVSFFIAGLKDEVRYPVVMREPKTLQQAYALSKMQDAQLTSIQTLFA